MKIQFKGECLKIGEEIRRKLDSTTIFILEKIGLPNRITPLSGVEYKILPNPYIYKYEDLVLGKTENTNSIHYLKMNIVSKKVYHQWNYNTVPEDVLINSSIEKMLLSEYAYTFFIRRLILSEALGAYYDKLGGGNYSKYANLLKDIIFDIDEEATKEGVWCSLIQEMSLGVI